MAHFIEIQSFPCLCSRTIKFHSNSADMILSLRLRPEKWEWDLQKMKAHKLRNITFSWQRWHCFVLVTLRVFDFVRWNKTLEQLVPLLLWRLFFWGIYKGKQCIKTSTGLENAICLLHNAWCVMSAEICWTIWHLSSLQLSEDNFREVTLLSPSRNRTINNSHKMKNWTE